VPPFAVGRIAFIGPKGKANALPVWGGSRYLSKVCAQSAEGPRALARFRRGHRRLERKHRKRRTLFPRHALELQRIEKSEAERRKLGKLGTLFPRRVYRWIAEKGNEKLKSEKENSANAPRSLRTLL
jgi:hypothetical protein